MGVAVAFLNPQDCLKQHFSRKALISPPPSQTKSSRSPNRSPPNRKPRRSPAGSVSPPPVDKLANRLACGSVKILKRGEDLPDRPAVAATGLLGPVPEPPPARPHRVAASDLVGGFYAGSSACIVSPPPSSLPLPAFFARKVEASTNSEATNALLKILRLDLE